MQGLLVEGRELAVHGTLLHMVNHSMIKLVLFMAAGVIFMNTHALDLNAIRGYGRNKPLLKVIFGTGALGDRRRYRCLADISARHCCTRVSSSTEAAGR